MTATTPPPTTLSTPSPTEQNTDRQFRHDASTTDDSEIPSASTLTAMNAALLRRPLYLIVATSTNPALGIGFKGHLPWPQIRSDMAYFRKVTMGTLSPSSSSAASSRQLRNAVVMGRKTYESIPSRFRPLSDRVNVVLTRSDVEGVADRVVRELVAASTARGGGGGDDRSEYRVVDHGTVGGLSGRVVCVVRRDEEQPIVVVADDLQKGLGVVSVTDVFCIGGAEVYALVLRTEEEALTRSSWGPLRVLQTMVRKLDGDGDGDGGGFECDTFWPGRLEDGVDGWKRVDREVVEREWTGVEAPDGDGGWKRDEKAGVEIQVVGWERTN